MANNHINCRCKFLLLSVTVNQPFYFYLLYNKEKILCEDNMEKTVQTKLNAEYVLLESVLDMVGHLGIVKDDKKLSPYFANW